MGSLTKLKAALNRLSKKRTVPKRLKKRVVACAERCDDALQKVRKEKIELETALESVDAENQELRSAVDFYRSLIGNAGIIQSLFYS